MARENYPDLKYKTVGTVLTVSTDEVRKQQVVSETNSARMVQALARIFGKPATPPTDTEKPFVLKQLR